MNIFLLKNRNREQIWFAIAFKTDGDGQSRRGKRIEWNNDGRFY